MNRQEQRREKNNSFIKKQGINCFEKLPLVEDSSEVTLKNLDEVCKKALSTFIIFHLSCDLREGNYDQEIDFYKSLIDRYGVVKSLNSLEKRILTNDCSKQDLIDMDWAYECYWVLCWALSLVDDISDAGEVCDSDVCIQIFQESDSYDSFKAKCKLRNVEEILDMFDLYFRYNWAVVEKRIHPDTSIGNLIPSAVVERRRALEWLISNETDWYEIQLNT